MTTLNFGVIDVPYADASYSAARLRKPKSKVSGSVTTGDVAEIIEEHYGLFEAFYLEHEEVIANLYMESLLGTIESLDQGAPVAHINPFATAETKIETMFKDWLSLRGMDGQTKDPRFPVPTAASLKGVSHRFKRAYKRRAARPSFIDTGLFEASVKVEIE